MDRVVAEKIGVARETVSRWRNDNPYFAAELNRRRKEIWGCAHLAALLDGLRRIGIFVVEVGEMEGFARTVSTHGAKWVAEVLKRDLAGDKELEDARVFSRSLMERVHERLGHSVSENP